MESRPATLAPTPRERRAVPGWLGHVAGGLVLLLLAVWFGRQFGHELPALELWIGRMGFWGWVIFVVATVLCTSCLIPDTVFAVMAGVLYGVVGGTTIISVAVLITALLNFALARRWLHGLVRRWLQRRPRLAAIERAVDREGLRFLVLLRLTPLSPVAVSYLLGTTRTRLGPFLVSSLALIPGLFVEVYLGHVAGHVVRAAGAPREHFGLHTVLTVLGLVFCGALLAYVTRIARRAIAEAELESAPVPAPGRADSTTES